MNIKLFIKIRKYETKKERGIYVSFVFPTLEIFNDYFYTNYKSAHNLGVVLDYLGLDINKAAQGFEKELSDEDMLFFYNLTKKQFLYRLFCKKSLWVKKQYKRYYIVSINNLRYFQLPRKRQEKKMLPKELYELKVLADDFENYCNEFVNDFNDFNPKKELDYRANYEAKYDKFLDLGQGADLYKYECKCGYKAFYNDFILGSDAGFAGKFIKKCPSCNRERGDRYDRQIGRKEEDFSITLEKRQKHIYLV